ncbi:MAG: HAMP domain-containing protein [Dehalococcoidia bacterium]
MAQVGDAAQAEEVERVEEAEQERAMKSRLLTLFPFRWNFARLLTLTIVLVIVGFVSVITLLDILRIQRIFWDELEVRGLLLAEGASDLLADPLYFTNIEEIDKVAAIVDRQSDISFVRVFNPEGRLITDTDSTKYPDQSSPNEFARQAMTEEAPLVKVNQANLEIAHPVTIEDEVVGSLWVGLGSASLQAQIRATIVEHLWQGGLLILLGIVVSYLVAQRFVRPIRKLVAATDLLSAGDLDARVSGVTGGELGDLAASFNRMARELQVKVQDLQESRARIVSAQEGVRRDIAGHLHGRVQGNLLVLKGQIQTLLPDNRLWAEAKQLLEEVVSQLDRIIRDELSGLSRRLYPSILRRGLVPALQSLGDQYEAALQIEVDLDEKLVQQERADRNLVPEPVRLAAYRIAEEALANVVKHAQASTANLRLSFPTEGSLSLAIIDNGQGYDVSQISAGLGMTAIQDYARAVGGEARTASAAGQGTEIRAELPLVMPG